MSIPANQTKTAYGKVKMLWVRYFKINIYLLIITTLLNLLIF